KERQQRSTPSVDIQNLNIHLGDPTPVVPALVTVQRNVSIIPAESTPLLPAIQPDHCVIPSPSSEQLAVDEPMPPVPSEGNVLHATHQERLDSSRSQEIQSDTEDILFTWVFDPVAYENEVALQKDFDPTYFDTLPPESTKDCPPQIPEERRGEPVYPGAPISINEAMVAVLSFMQSEHLSGKGLDRLLSLISLFLIKPNNFVKSAQAMFRSLKDESQGEPVDFQYYCNNCYKTRSSESDLCDVCTGPNRSVQYFISCPIIPQLQRLYQRKGFLEELQYRFKRLKLSADNYEDVYDSELYKQQVASGVLANPHNISMTWNVDGLEIYESNTYQIWPLYLVINELPPNKRYLSENLILAGMSCGFSKPHPDVYMKSIYSDFKKLKGGVGFRFYGSNEPHVVVCILLRGVCDSPARALFLNLKTHSGFYCCHVCYIRGENSPQTGDVTVFPYEENIPLRSLEDYEDQVKWATEHMVLHNTALLNEPQCCGVKGPTLSSFVVDNMLESTSVDSMHCAHLGIGRQIIHLLFEHKWRNEPFSLHFKTEEVSARLLRARLPHFVQRSPQSLEKIAHWKASARAANLYTLGRFNNTLDHLSSKFQVSSPSF
ncbi:Recombination protein RecR, partial [Frankliniella fusca]